jgi:hypothetical protein
MGIAWVPRIRWNNAVSEYECYLPCAVRFFCSDCNQSYGQNPPSRFFLNVVDGRRAIEIRHLTKEEARFRSILLPG